MDNLEFYRQTIETVLRKYAEISSFCGTIEQHLTVDRDHLMLFNVSWLEKRRVHGCVTYVQIIDDKIWIQRDGITGELVEAGISKDKMVLGFQPPHVRPHRGYAIA